MDRAGMPSAVELMRQRDKLAEALLIAAAQLGDRSWPEDVAVPPHLVGLDSALVAVTHAPGDDPCLEATRMGDERVREGVELATSLWDFHRGEPRELRT